jgi:hypothetical protein
MTDELNVHFITYVTVFTINIYLVYTWLTHRIIDIGQLHAFVTQCMMDVLGMPQDVRVYFDLIFP